MQSLIDAQELKHRLHEPGLKVLHVHLAPIGGQADASPVCLIPGAQIFDIEAMSDGSKPVPHSALPPDEFAKRVRALGINSSDEIVVYDEKGVYSSPRAWFLFLNAGHSKVRVLNGGLPAWIAAGGEVSTQVEPAPSLGDFSARTALRSFVDRHVVQSVISSQGEVLLDARNKERYQGEVEEPRPGLRKGHIPSALSTPFSEVLNGGKLKDPEELSRYFALCFPHEKPVIAYCGSGVTACILALALEASGHPPARIYDGSWSEWGALTFPSGIFGI